MGVLSTIFTEESQTTTHTPIDSGAVLPPGLPIEVPTVLPSNTTSTYNKNAFIFALGADIAF